eukprot:4810005-Amphidinium_carterae.1
MEKNELDYKQISSSDYYYDLEQKLGETVDRSTVRSTVWTARWVHRVKGDGVRSGYVARQFKNATDEVESD